MCELCERLAIEVLVGFTHRKILAIADFVDMVFEQSLSTRYGMIRVALRRMRSGTLNHRRRHYDELKSCSDVELDLSARPMC